jgi:hypothetical protein
MDHAAGLRWWVRKLLFRLGLSRPPSAMWFQRAARGPFWRRRQSTAGEPAPADIKAPPRPPWSGPPESELGVAVPVRTVIAATAKLVVALTDCAAYTSGFEFTIAVRSQDDMSPHALGFGPGPPWERSDDGLLEIGVTFADGREGSGSGHAPSQRIMDYYSAASEGRDPELPPGPVVMQGSGSAGGRRADFRYWVWPLPPEGPLTIWCRWPAADVPLARHELDGGAIRRAGAGSQDLWR